MPKPVLISTPGTILNTGVDLDPGQALPTQTSQKGQFVQCLICIKRWTTVGRDAENGTSTRDLPCIKGDIVHQVPGERAEETFLLLSSNLHHIVMACFNPSHTMPAAISNVGFGSCRTGPNISGWGDSGFSGSGGAFTGGSSSILGLTSGANIARTSQLPPSEIMIQPPTCVLTIPEPVVSTITPPMILSSSSPYTYGSPGYGSGPSSVGGRLRGDIMGGFQSIGQSMGRCNIYRCPC